MRKQYVWIMTDSTRYDMLGCYGNAAMITPNLDRLAENGIRFSHAYTSQPVCGPARSCLFTGLYPHENGMLGNSMYLAQNVKTIGQLIHNSGIECGYIGKWHLDGGDYFGYGKCPDGWNEKYWYDMKCYLDELPSDEERMRSRKKKTCLEGNGIPAEYTYGHQVTERALQFIDEFSQDDFFLTVSYDEPHGPSLCPKEYATMYSDFAWPDSPAYHDTLEEKPAYQKLWAKTCDVESARRPSVFLGCNSYIDSEIGRVIDKVHSVAPDALIMFTSDHGEAHGAHGLNHKGPTLYDETIRTPLIFEGKHILRKRVFEHAVSHASLPATVLDYFGISIPKEYSADSLLTPLCKGENSEEGMAFVEFNRYERDHDGFGGLQMMRGIVTDHYKLALHLCDTDELYDIDQDPHCIRNLIHEDSCKHTRNILHDRLLQWMNDTRDPFRGYQWKCRSWRTDYTPDWEVDGWTRQHENEENELRQLDYDTGLPMTDACRPKKK